MKPNNNHHSTGKVVPTSLKTITKTMKPCMYCARTNHPSDKCRLKARLCNFYPNCAFGSDCRYVHPLCKFGIYCDDFHCKDHHSAKTLVVSTWITLDYCLKKKYFVPVELRKMIKLFLSLDDKTIREAKQSFYGPISEWVTTSVTDMSNLLADKEEFNFNIEDWDVSNVTNMHAMFYNCRNFNQPLNRWNVSKVTNMSGMFRRAVSFNQCLDDWDIKQVTNIDAMFSLTENQWRPILDKWREYNIARKAHWSIWLMMDCICAKYFHLPVELRKVINLYLSLDNQSIREAVSLWHAGIRADHQYHQYSIQKYGPISDWITTGVTDMSRLFYEAEEFNENIERWDVSNVTDMSWMFYRASKFNQSLNDWNVRRVVNVRGMLRGASAFNQSFDKWGWSPDQLDVMYD